MNGAFVRARWGVLGLIGLVLLVGSGWREVSRPVADGTAYEQARLFETVLNTIRRQYVDSLGEGALYQAAASALVTALGDPYAELLTGDSYRQYRLDVAGDQVGSLTPDLGDKVVTRRVTPTTVHVSAASRGVLLDHTIGYVALHRVSDGAVDELRAEIDRLRAQGMTRLVLDLRLNPGGLISQGVKIAGLFLTPGDTVAVSVGRGVDRSHAYAASMPGDWNDMPVVVLVNRGTASSAELITAALQDHDRIVVVGTPTYGKGVLQTTYPIGENAAIKLTTARWYAPSGRSIQRARAGQFSVAGRTVAIDSDRIFRTDMGREVPQGRGIVPDLLVRSTARSETEQAFLAALGSDVALFRSDLAAYAEQLAAGLGQRAEIFEVSRKMRDELYDRMVASGIQVPRETYTAAAAYVEDELDYEVTRLALGPRAEARHRIRSDRQLQAALTILRRARTQEQALALTALTRQAVR